MFDPLFVSIVGFLCFMLGVGVHSVIHRCTAEIDRQIAEVVHPGDEVIARRLLESCDL